MKKLFHIQSFFIAMLFLSQGCSAEPGLERFNEGDQYKLVPASNHSEPAEKVTVVEFFSYGCPHCFSLESNMKEWKKTAPDYVEFSMMPAYWNPQFELLAQAFYTAQGLGAQDKIHTKLFEAIHVQGRKFATEGALRDFFEEQGVAKEDFDKMFNSFSIKQKMKQANARFKQFGLRGVPGVVIGGKYFTDVRSAGSREAVPEVINFLVRKAKAAEAKSK